MRGDKGKVGEVEDEPVGGLRAKRGDGGADRNYFLMEEEASRGRRKRKGGTW